MTTPAKKAAIKKPWLWGLSLAVLALILVGLLALPTPVKARIFSFPLPKLPLKNVWVSPSSAAGQSAEAEWAKIEAMARREGRVTMYSWSWTPSSAAPISHAFAQKYGIEVEVVAGRGPQFLERLQQEARAGHRIGDILEGAQTHLRNTKLAGLTLSALELPVLQDNKGWVVSPLHLDSQGHLVGYAPYILSPYVNTALVLPSEEPRSWLDLLQPRWKGRMVMPNPRTSTVPYYMDILIQHNALPKDYPLKLSQQRLLLSDQTPDSGELLAWGQAALSVLNGAPDMVTPLKEGGAIKAIDMKEGVLLNLLTLTLLKDSPHPNAARLLLNWLLTPEGQEAHSRAKEVASLRKGMTDFVPPLLRLKPKKVMLISADDGEKIARAFREKTYVPVFSPAAP